MRPTFRRGAYIRFFNDQSTSCPINPSSSEAGNDHATQPPAMPQIPLSPAHPDDVEIQIHSPRRTAHTGFQTGRLREEAKFCESSRSGTDPPPDRLSRHFSVSEREGENISVRQAEGGGGGGRAGGGGRRGRGSQREREDDTPEISKVPAAGAGSSAVHTCSNCGFEQSARRPCTSVSVRQVRPSQEDSEILREEASGVLCKLEDDAEDEAKFVWYADFLEGWQRAKQAVASFWREKCTRAHAQRFAMDRFPLLEWLPKYTMGKFVKDVQAGLVVACILIPQGMGYADVAGLPFVAGLYSGFTPLFIYFTMSCSMQVAIGPVAIISLIVSQSVPACNKLCAGADGVLIQEAWPSCANKCGNGESLTYNDEYWVLSSCIALLAGVAQSVGAPLLGFIMNFVPHPVICGFTSAGGLIIAMSQVKSIVGFKIRKENLQWGVYDLFHDIHKAHTITVIMGTAAIILLSTIRQLGRGWAWFCPRSKVPGSVRKICKLPWPFILIIVYTLVTWQLGLDKRGVEVTGKVPSGLPPFQWPKNFFENVPMLVSAAMQIVIIGFLETFAVESHFATKRRYQVRATQEAFAIGVANIFGGLTHCYPVTGSFSRSAVNAENDSQSPMANLVTGTVIMVTLLVLTRLFYYLPQCALAANVIVAALGLVDLHEPAFLWVSSKKEFCLLAITFCLTAFHSPEAGIYVSVALCLGEVVWNATRCHVAVISPNLVLVYLPGTESRSDARDLTLLPESLKGHGVLVIRVEGTLNFTAATSLKNIISKQLKEALGKRNINALVFDLTHMEIADTSALAALISIVDEIERHNIAVFIAGISPGLRRFLKIDSVKAKLSNVGLNETLKEVSMTEELGLLPECCHGASDTESRISAASSRYRSSLAQAVSAAIQTDDMLRRRHELERDRETNPGDKTPVLGYASPNRQTPPNGHRSPSEVGVRPSIPLDASNWI